jgi:hypothetical protein
VAEHLSSSVGARESASICFVCAFTARRAFGLPRRSHQRNLHRDRGSAALVPTGMASGFTGRGCHLGKRLLGPRDGGRGRGLERRPPPTYGGPEGAGSAPQPLDAIWFAAARRKGYREVRREATSQVSGVLWQR